MYVVIGANGFLGAYVRKAILELTNETILATARTVETIPTKEDKRVQWLSCRIESEEDLQQLNQEMKKSEKNKVIFLAAYHHPDQVEKNPDKAWKINIIALANALFLLKNADQFYYPSTDTVYGDGTLKQLFIEEDTLHPANLYGKQKAAAEGLVTAYGHHVVRFPFLFGPSLLPHKQHFCDELTAALKKRQPIQMFQDSYRSALDFESAARLLIALMECKKQVPFILNLAGDEALSKYDIGLRLADKLNVPRTLVVPISSQEDQEIFTVKRAQVTLLSNQKVKQLLELDEIRFKL